MKCWLSIVFMHEEALTGGELFYPGILTDIPKV